jgi:hypothetical protein
MHARISIPARRARRIRRALFPIVERDMTHGRYAHLLDRLLGADATLVTLREFRGTGSARTPVVGLRHDVDEDLDHALEIGRIEHDRGVRSTFFVLQTAPYWSRPDLIDALVRLQDDYGHEIGWHNDLVTGQCVYGQDPRETLVRELHRLREAGLSIVGSASHGSPFCHRFGYHNNYFFTDFADEIDPLLPNNRRVRTPKGEHELVTGSLAEFGFEYEAYHLDNDLYFADTADSAGRRWHPDRLDPARLGGHKAIILTHPCHWDSSRRAKVGRFARMVAARRWRDPAGAL